MELKLIITENSFKTFVRTLKFYTSFQWILRLKRKLLFSWVWDELVVSKKIDEIYHLVVAGQFWYLCKDVYESSSRITFGFNGNSYGNNKNQKIIIKHKNTVSNFSRLAISIGGDYSIFKMCISLVGRHVLVQVCSQNIPFQYVERMTYVRMTLDSTEHSTIHRLLQSSRSRCTLLSVEHYNIIFFSPCSTLQHSFSVSQFN